MPKTGPLDRRVYNAVRAYLIKERLEKTPVVKVVGDVNCGRVSPVNAGQVIECIQRHAFYRNYTGYSAMYTRAGIVFLNS